MFIMSFDALALSLAAFVTALLGYMLWIQMGNREQSLIIFLIASIVALMLVRLIIAPKLQWDDVTNPMSWDTIIWKKFVVQKANWREVIKYEWMYWNIRSDTDFKVWETVKVLSMDDNIVLVEKID